MLAIVIPAYKAEFLKETLESFEKQTNKEFTIYIGDDASPQDIYSIVEGFHTQLHIVYRRFDENLGSRSLTKHWERCIDMINGEEWIWLFSDDDVVSSDAVDTFYTSILVSKSKLFKYKVNIINERHQIILNTTKWKNVNSVDGVLHTDKFIDKRLSCNGYASFVVEYIFHRSLYEAHKFVDFPLAWCSDDATWIMYSLLNCKRIEILDSYVFWRYSGLNISSITISSTVRNSKLEAASGFVHWIRNLKVEGRITYSEHKLHKWFMMQLSTYYPEIKWTKFIDVNRKNGFNSNYLSFFFYFIRNIVKSRLKIFIRGI